MQRIDYRDYLEKEYESRRRRNPGYSMRAFARDIRMHPSKLSEVLRKVCGLSSTSGKKIATSLKLSGPETEIFINLIEAEHSRSKSGKTAAKKRLEEIREAEGFEELSLERFAIISDWYHYAILELTELKNFRSDSRAIARRLGLKKDQVDQAIERLLDFGLLKREPGGRLVQTHALLATPSGIPSRALREHHSQVIQKADQALQTVPVHERDFSSMTMAIDDSRIDEARKYLREFRRRFCKELENGGEKNKVYCLSMQFFPLTQEQNPSGESYEK